LEESTKSDLRILDIGEFLFEWDAFEQGNTWLDEVVVNVIFQ